jgi:hypothetical protein
MRRKCGRHAGVAAICLFTGWAALHAPAAVIREMTPRAEPAAVPAIPAGDPKLASGLVEPAPPSVNVTRPKLSSPPPLSIDTHPPAPELLNAGGDRPAVPSSGPKLNVTRADDVQVGPTGLMVEVPIVPEPSTGLLMCAVGFATLARRGRRVHARGRSEASDGNGPASSSLA